MIIGLIQLGCDPYGKDISGCTPFHYALDFEPIARAKFRYLEAWLNLLCEAGVSLETSWRTVEEQLATRPRTTTRISLDRVFTIEQPLPGLSPSDWDFIGYFHRHVPIWLPLKMPGQSEAYYDSCPVLPWEPTREDACILSNDMLSVGVWQKGSLKLISAPVSLRSLAQREDDFARRGRFEIYDRCKDDLELNYVFREHWRRKSPQRSRSQPPDWRSSFDLDIRDYNRFLRKSDLGGLKWHICRLDSRWRLHESYSPGLEDDMECMAGCPLDLSQFQSKISGGLQWAARRYMEGADDHWDMRYPDREDRYKRRLWKS